MLKLIKLTEEEIDKLPFPETARAIGGILDIANAPLNEELFNEIRKQFQKIAHNTSSFRTPIIKDEDA